MILYEIDAAMSPVVYSRVYVCESHVKFVSAKDKWSLAAMHLQLEMHQITSAKSQPDFLRAPDATFAARFELIASWKTLITISAFGKLCQTVRRTPFIVQRSVMRLDLHSNRYKT